MKNIDAERAAPTLPRDYFAWWTSIETDVRKSMLVFAHREPERLHALVRQAYEAGQQSIEAARRTPSASIGEDGLPELPPTCHVVRNGLGGIAFYAYSPEEMEAYAREAILADRRAREIPKGAALGQDGTVYHGIAEAWHQMEEAYALHEVLDEKKVPRTGDKGQAYSLYGRVEKLVADLRAQLARQSKGALVAELVHAADAVVERWHSRDWKQPHTAEFINRLATAVGAMKFAAPPLSSEQQSGEGA